LGASIFDSARKVERDVADWWHGHAVDKNVGRGRDAAALPPLTATPGRTTPGEPDPETELRYGYLVDRLHGHPANRGGYALDHPYTWGEVTRDELATALTQRMGVRPGGPSRELKEFRDLIVPMEGRVGHVYLDSLGFPTVGIGHRVLPGDNLRVGDALDDGHIDELFERDASVALSSPGHRRRRRASRMMHLCSR
jgi:hypothetical protein